MPRIYGDGVSNGLLNCELKFKSTLIKIGNITGILPDNIYPSSEIHLCTRNPYLIPLWLYCLGIRPQFIRNIVRNYHIALIAKILGTVLSRGMGSVLALELAEAAVANEAYREALRHARRTVLLGGRLSDAFIEFPDLFPLSFTHSLHASELIGGLSEKFLYIANVHNEQTKEGLRYRTRPAALTPLSDFEPIEALLFIGLLMFLSTLLLLAFNPLQ